MLIVMSMLGYCAALRHLEMSHGHRLAMNGLAYEQRIHLFSRNRFPVIDRHTCFMINPDEGRRLELTPEVRAAELVHKAAAPEQSSRTSQAGAYSKSPG